MDLNGRVDRMDEELKLLKNEIKQVLLEVQEHVLNVQSPFAGAGSAGFAPKLQTPNLVEKEAPVAAPVAVPVAAPAAAPVTAPVTAPAAAPVAAPVAAPAAQPSIYIDTSQGGRGGPASGQPPPSNFGGLGSPMGSQNSPGRGVVQQDPFVEAGGPRQGAPDSAMSEPSPSPFSLDESPGSPPSLDESLESQAEIDDMLNSIGAEDDDGPSAGPPPPSITMEEPVEEPKKSQKAPAASAEDKQDEKALEDEDKDELTRRLRKLLEQDSEEAAEFVVAATLEDKDESADTKADTPQKDRSRRAEDTAPPGIIAKEESMDLVTLAGLAQWAERALNRVGSEHLKALLEVSEMTGRIPKEMKDALILLLPLLDDRDRDRRITAKEIVSLMAQLGGFLGSGTMNDLRLLPFLLQDDTEVFPSIRR